MDIKSLHNQFDGKCYILGNAPSLYDLDIDYIAKQNSFFCNSAYKIGDFKPKFFVVSNANAFRDSYKQFSTFSADHKLYRQRVKDVAKEEFHREVDHIYGYKFSGKYMDSENSFSPDPYEKGVNCGHTVVIDAIQLAYYLGFREIFIGGVDLQYNASNPYFYGKSAIPPRSIPYERCLRSFDICKEFLEANGASIYKITESPKLSCLTYIEPSTLK